MYIDTNVSNASEDLLDILVTAEAEYAELTQECMRVDFKESILASEAEGAEGGEGKWAALKKFVARIGAFFSSVWKKISSFFASAFAKLAAVVQSDAKTVAKAEERGYKRDITVKMIEPKEAMGNLEKLASDLASGTEGNLMQRVARIVGKPADGKQQGISTLAKEFIYDESKEKDTDIKGAAAFNVQVAVAKDVISKGKNLSNLSKIAKMYAADSVKKTKILQSAVDKKDTEAATAAKAKVETARKNASHVSAVMSAMISGYNRIRSKVVSAVVQMSTGSNKAATGGASESTNSFFDSVADEGTQEDSLDSIANLSFA